MICDRFRNFTCKYFFLTKNYLLELCLKVFGIRQKKITIFFSHEQAHYILKIKIPLN
jgi:hypothetical protein